MRLVEVRSDLVGVAVGPRADERDERIDVDGQCCVGGRHEGGTLRVRFNLGHQSADVISRYERRTPRKLLIDEAIRADVAEWHAVRQHRRGPLALGVVAGDAAPSDSPRIQPGSTARKETRS